jgi:hypothetical protein
VVFGKPDKILCRWISPDKNSQSKNTSLSVKYSDNSKIVLEVDIPGFYANNWSSNSKDYSEFILPGNGYTHEAAKPSLPIIYRLIEIPDNVIVSLGIVNLKEHKYFLNEIGITHPVVPVQSSKPVSEHSKVKNAELEKNDIFYMGDHFYPGKIVKINNGGILRGRRFIRLQLAPVQYNPSSQMIRFVSHFKVEIVLEDKRKTSEIKKKYSFSKPFEKILKPCLLNLNGIEKDLIVDNSKHISYLVITEDNFIDPLQPLIRWKRQSGFDVIVSKLSEVGRDTSDIREYIKWTYETFDPPPSYLLLVGDTDKIPANKGRKALNPHIPHNTDLYYATMDGENDIFPDLIVGRFPARDTNQVRIMVEKSLFYEKLNKGESDWINRASFIATNDPVFHEIVEKGHRNSINKFLSPHGVSCDTIWTYSETNTQNFIDTINRGCSIINYSGHGSEFYWEDLDKFNLIDIYNLKNVDRYPLVMSYGCNAGDFGQVECLGESWLRYEKRGGSLFIGATGLAFWYEDYYLQNKFIEAAVNKKDYSVGELFNQALLKVYERGYPMAEYYYEIYHILGDPSLPVWIGCPDSLSVDYPDTVEVGSSKIDVTIYSNGEPIDGAFVSVNQGTKKIGSVYSINSKAPILFNNTMSYTDNLLLTVTKSQYFPFQSIITVPDEFKVIFTPDTLSVNKITDLNILIKDDQDVAVEDIIINISGLGIHSLQSCTTDVHGFSEIRICSPYGQKLQVTGKKISGDYNIFNTKLLVSDANRFNSCEIISLVHEVNVDDILMPGIRGEVFLDSDPQADIYYLEGCNIDTTISTNYLKVIPDMQGEIKVTFVKNGFQIEEKLIHVEYAFGFLSGQITDSSTGIPIDSVSVSIVSSGHNNYFQLSTDSTGKFSLNDSLVVGHYYINAHRFGYVHFSDSVVIGRGENYVDISLSHKNPATISGQIRLEGQIRHDGIVVSIQGQSRQDTTSVTGHYLIPNIIPDTLFILAVKDGFITQKYSRIVTDNECVEGIDFFLKRGINEIDENFEDHNGYFINNGEWEWGKPGPGLYERGPQSAYSGQNVWGTMLDGDYSSNADFTLDSPVISLTGFIEPILEFYHYYQMDRFNTGFDGGNIKITKNIDKFWSILYPEEGYPCDSISNNNYALAGEPAFSGFIHDWEHVKVNLSDYIDQQIIIRFHFASTEKVEDAGWYIDNFKIYDTVQSHGPPSPENYYLSENYPNPFNSETIIHYQLPVRGRVVLKLFNILGREIFTLVDTYNDPGNYWIHWDGRNRFGTEMSSGIYLFQIRAGEFIKTRKMIILR